jgi:DsbC/DsbD-like thiol-disulfide interchange protein
MLLPALLAALTPAPHMQPADTHHTKITIVAERPGITPGGSVTLAFVFEMDKDWHLYWPGQNDTGQPPEIDAGKLPPGFTLGPIAWPVPKRYIQPGDILDHIYETKFVLLAELTAPKDAKPSTTLALEFQINWMECSSECRLAEGVVKASLPVVEKTPEPTDKPLFTQARAAIPPPLPKDSPIKITIEGETLTISAPDAERLTFLPHADSTPLTNAISAGEARGGTLRAKLAPPTPSADAASAVGILRVRDAKTTSSWWIDTRPKTDSKDKSGADPRPNPEPARTTPPR